MSNARKMNAAAAITEARRRWGDAGAAVQLGHPLGYVVGHYFPREPDDERAEPVIQIHGTGETWEDAFARADEELCVPYWPPTAAGFRCSLERFVAQA